MPKSLDFSGIRRLKNASERKAEMMAIEGKKPMVKGKPLASKATKKMERELDATYGNAYRVKGIK